jgi:hypothetical protein
MSKTGLSHKQFKEKYKKGELEILVNKKLAGDLVLSPQADPKYKPVHLFWTWLGIIFTIPIPIILLFISWVFAPIVFVIGLIVSGAVRKSAGQFVIQNMIEDEIFWNYVILHSGAILQDKNGDQINF